MTSQTKLLSGLFGCLFLAGMYAYYASPEQQRVEVKRENSSVVRSPAPATGQQERIRFDLLEERRAASSRPRQDIFRPLFEVSTGPVARVAVSEPKPVPAVVIAPPPQPKPAPPPPSSREVAQKAIERELATFVYKGGVQKKGYEKVFLAGKDEIFVVGVGESFGTDRSYRVESISAAALTVREQQDGRRIIIPLRDQEKLVPEFQGE